MLSIARRPLRALAVLTLAGCGQIAAMPPGGGSAVAPPHAGAQSLLAPRPAAERAARRHARSWMLPAAKHDNLLYIAYPAQYAVAVYQYPGRQQIGELTGFAFPDAVCSDAEGDVYVADLSADKVFEYAHGGTNPIRTLTVSGGYPQACAADPTTGNVAVSLESFGYTGYVAVYPSSGSGNPQPYVAPNIYNYGALGYDDAGNLYVDGLAQYGSDVQLAGLPHGGYGMVAITPNAGIQEAGPVQWDGKFLAVGDGNGDGVIHRFAIDWVYDKAIEAGSVQLAGIFNSVGVSGWWIQGKRIVSPLIGAAVVEYWHYPGGAEEKYFDGLSAAGYSATVSKAPR